MGVLGRLFLLLLLQAVTDEQQIGVLLTPSSFATNITGGVAGAIAFAIVVFRAYYHVPHPAFVWPAPRGNWYPRHPVAWDDMCSLPFPRLHELLVAYTNLAPEAGAQEIERLISSYPSRRMAGLRANAI